MKPEEEPLENKAVASEFNNQILRLLAVARGTG
jgi:hypothetical protein